MNYRTQIPMFFIIGAAKAATTSLSSLLATHPEAGIVEGKEPHFFSYNEHYQRGWREYMKLFRHCNRKRVIGDASTSYSRLRYNPFTLERIYKHVPDARIIYMVRHPLKRMESAYVEHVCSDRSNPFTSINEAVRQLPMIVDSSRYWEVFDAYRKTFGEKQIKVVWFEEYIANKQAVFSDVCRFLDIDHTIPPDLGCEEVNSRKHVLERAARGAQPNHVNIQWTKASRAWVIQQIRADNCCFLAHFGRQQDFWGAIF